MDAAWLILAGVAAGLVSGMLGVGGGIVFVPALVLVTGVTQVEAQATSLLAIIPVSIVGAWSQNRYGNCRIPDAVAIGLLSVVGAVAGVALANELPERALELGFAALSVFVAGQLVWRVRKRRMAAAREHAAGPS